ncbi:PSP1 C-terminal domain protein [Filifactor alocis ATCC 35896]|uniref:PSP1 C-terminal domain protein n=2 Tax=Filifactor TaxID=44259 RepID=D6GSM7_FILAD|nr:stage 0 sporulation family protein [Filifactor alocis]EFE28668.1 PSP1 C-terminal domain protein [Filifactor alocis ATCC 35896]
MIEVIGIRFKKAGKIYYFNPNGVTTEFGDKVIVETVRGIEIGIVEVPSKELKEESFAMKLKPVVRKATQEDLDRYEENKKKEKEAEDIFIKKSAKHNLEMNLVDTEYTFDRSKLIFYFTADGRIDFRELVKELAAIFRTRIELRQIGVRDEAKTMGGIGCCGRPLCCSTWLGDFQSVSIKMAKDQNLSLNPTKISGICGRLFCCLNYEHQVYEGILREMPNVGSIVQTPDGKGKVLETKTILEEVKVQVENKKADTIEVKKYPLSEIKILKNYKRKEKKNDYDEHELKKLLED